MTSKEQCGDDRFEIINETKEYIINATNIDTSPEEMVVLDNICFRLWQLGLTKRNKDKLTELENLIAKDCIAGEQVGLSIVNALIERGNKYKNKLKELQNILEEYNVTPEILREVLLTGQMFRNQHTFDECIKEWEKLGYKVTTLNNGYLIDIVNSRGLTAFKIDLKNKKYIKLDSVIFHMVEPITFEEHYLLTKTLKALEVDK